MQSVGLSVLIPLWTLIQLLPTISSLEPRHVRPNTPCTSNVSCAANDIDDLERATLNKTNSCAITLTEFLVYFYLQPVICLSGFIFNLINVAVFQKPQFSGAAYAYMTAMSMADAITLISYMPSGLVRCAGYFPYCQHALFKKFRVGMLYYNTYVLFPLGNMSEAASVWFTVLLSVERYLAMRQLGISFRSNRNSAPPNTEMELNSLSRVSENRKHGVDENPSNQQTSNCIQALVHEVAHCQPFIRAKSCLNCKLSVPLCCKRMNYRHSIAFVTVFSILLNLPLFFVQSVITKIYADPPLLNASLTITKRPAHLIKLPKPKIYTGLTKFGNSEFYKAFSWLRVVLVQALPFVFLCIANFCLLHFIQMAADRRQKVLVSKQLKAPERKMLYKPRMHKENLRNPVVNGGSSSRWQTAQRKLTILLIVIVALFIAGQIPQAFAYVTIFEVFNRHFGSTCKRWSCCPPYLIFRAVAHMICLFTYAVNFFVYLTLNKHFKNQLKSWCSSFCPKCFSVCCTHSLQLLSHPSHLSNSSRPQIQSNRKVSAIRPTATFGGVPYNPYHGRQTRLLAFSDLPSEAVSAPVYCEIGYESHSPVCGSHSPAAVMQEGCRSIIHTIPSETYLGVTEWNSSTSKRQTPQHSFTDSVSPLNQSRTRGTELTSYKKPSDTLKTFHKSECLTEIQYGEMTEPYISQGWKTYFSHDSVLKKVIFSNKQCNRGSVCKVSLDFNSLAKDSASQSFVRSSSSDVSHPRYQIREHQGSGINLPDETEETTRQVGKSESAHASCAALKFSRLHALYHSEKMSDSKDSDSSFSRALSPLVYQESDFDVISVDESLEPQENSLFTAV